MDQRTAVELPPGNLYVVDLLRLTVGAIAKNGGSLALLAALSTLPLLVAVALPTLLAANVANDDSAPSGLNGSSLMVGAVYVFFLFFSQWCHGAAVFLVVEHLSGKKVSSGQALSHVSQRIGNVVGAGLFPFAVVGMSGFVCGILAVFLWLMWILSTPVCVMEGLEVADAMKKSAKLTSGHRSSLFLCWLLEIALLLVIVGIAVTVADFFQARSESVEAVASVIGTGTKVILINGFLSMTTPALLASAYFLLAPQPQKNAVSELSRVFS